MSPRRAKAVSGRVGDDPATALREHLVDTVEKLLLETPASAITTREVARAAGVSDGVLYNYFRDKHDLIVAALMRRYVALAAEFEAGLPEAGAGEVRQSLALFAGRMIRLADEAVPILAALITEPILFHRVFEELHRLPNGPQYLQARLADYVEGERRLGRLRVDVDPTAVGSLLMGSIVTLALTTHVAPVRGEEFAAERIGAIVDTLVRGIEPQPQP